MALRVFSFRTDKTTFIIFIYIGDVSVLYLHTTDNWPNRRGVPEKTTDVCRAFLNAAENRCLRNKHE